jgi:hypothetical protein
LLDPATLQLHNETLLEMVKQAGDKLSDEENVKLARHGYLIRDRRPEEKLSAAFERTDESLSNPTETGIYELLVKPGEFARCLIIVGPKGKKEDERGAVAVRLEGDTRNYVVAHPSRLFVRLPAESREDFAKWFDGLSDASLEAHSGKYILVAPDREATIPFRVTATNDGVYEVWGCFYPDSGPDFMQPAFEDGLLRNNQYSYRRHDLELLEKKDDKYTAFRFFNGKLDVPAKAKAIKLSESDDLLSPGDLSDLELSIKQKHASLVLRVDGPEASINRGKPRTKLAALWSLVSDHGFSEDDANELLKRAEIASLSGRGVRVLVKYGEASRLKQAYGAGDGSGLLMDPGQLSPQFPDPTMNYSPWSGGAMQQEQLEQAMPVQGIGAQVNDPSVYDPSPDNMPDPMLMQHAQQAGQTNQREVFDTAMLGSMLKNVRQNTLVQTYVRDLLKALDRLGRIYFMLCWHSEEFADRYGKQDMPELEDGVRNAFESLGDLTLFLKEKDVEPLGAGNLGETNIDEVAG